jgi:hypothetical protein
VAVRIECPRRYGRPCRQSYSSRLLRLREARLPVPETPSEERAPSESAGERVLSNCSLPTKFLFQFRSWRPHLAHAHRQVPAADPFLVVTQRVPPLEVLGSRPHLVCPRIERALRRSSLAPRTANTARLVPLGPLIPTRWGQLTGRAEAPYAAGAALAPGTVASPAMQGIERKAGSSPLEMENATGGFSGRTDILSGRDQPTHLRFVPGAGSRCGGGIRLATAKRLAPGLPSPHRPRCGRQADKEIGSAWGGEPDVTGWRPDSEKRPRSRDGGLRGLRQPRIRPRATTSGTPPPTGSSGGERGGRRSPGGPGPRAGGRFTPGRSSLRWLVPSAKARGGLASRGLDRPAGPLRPPAAVSDSARDVTASARRRRA